MSVGPTSSAAGLDPSRFDKPEMPLVTEVQKQLAELRSLVEKGQGADGSVDVAALRADVAATGDADLARELEALIDAFPVIGSVTFPVGCSGVVTRATHTDPTTLGRGDVQRVLADLAAARLAAPELDADGDGRLSDAEAYKAGEGLAGTALNAATARYTEEMAAWSAALLGVAHSIEARGEVDERIQKAASRHAKTPEGTAALVAAYRDLVTQGKELPSLKDTLDGAEQSRIRRFLLDVPLFGAAARVNHLSDDEVGRLLGTKDLGAYTADRNQQIEARLGRSYDDYLAGKDLAGVDDLDDPDRRVEYYRPSWG